MRCNSIQADLLDFANHETPFLRTWIIRRHVVACRECAAELAALQEFQTALRRADLVPPEPVPVPVRLHSPRRRATAAAFAAVLVGSLFLYPALQRPSRPNVQNPGAAIAAALGRVNTWHFAGWKQIDGKQVPWEVWGRRTPQLYYERVGDTVTWSDGKTHLRVFPPNPALKRPQGLLIKTSVDQTRNDSSFLNDPAYQSFVTDGPSLFPAAGGWYLSLYAQDSRVAKYRVQNYRGMNGTNENKIYTISKETWLPTTYQLHFENPKISRDTEYLNVHYGDPLPDEVVAAPAPSGYAVIDFTQPNKQAVIPGNHIVQSHGLQVQAEPVGIDKEGNILIAVRGWLGGNRLTPASAFSLTVSPTLYEASPDGTVAGERQGQKVKYLFTSNRSLEPGSDLYLPFSPLEPSEVSGALPETLDLSLSASPQVQVRSSDRLEADGTIDPSSLPENLFTETFHWNLPLPQPVRDLATVLPVGVDPKFYLPSESDVDENRRIYYALSDDFQAAFYEKVFPSKLLRKFRNPDGSLNYYQVNGGVPLQQMEATRSKHAVEYKELEQSFRRKAIPWVKRKIEATSRMQGVDPGYKAVRMRNDTFYLAELYQISGDTAGMKRTLWHLIADTQNDPSYGVLHRQAEFAIRTGQFPDDADYKGPS